MTRTTIVPSTAPRLRRAVALACTVLAVAGLQLTGLGAARADVRSVVLTPTNFLSDGQVVQVRWSGYTVPGSAISIYQCKAGATTRADCVQAGSANGRPRQADGTGSFLFRVKAGDSLPEFRCDVTTPCSIGVFEVNPADGLLDFAAAVITTVKFAPTADSCPAGLTKSLTGVVASGSFRASLSWAAIACQGSTALDLNPTLGSSPDAKLAFLRGDVDVAVTGDPIGPDDVLRATESMAGAPLAQRSYTYAPATASGLAIVYNMRDFVTGEQIVDLKLTPDLIAKIFTGQISTPDDDGGSMRALNPTHTLPIFTRAVMRAENDADTLQFSTWLYGTARAAYEAGGEQFTHGPLLGWPSTDRYQLRTGADDVALTVLGAENDPQRLGYLGVVDTSTAAFYGLSTAFVLNGAGAFVQPNQDGMAKGIPFAQHIRPDGSMVPANLAAPDAGAYPLAKIGYLVVPTSGLDARPDYRDSLLTALTFAAGPGQRVGDDDRVLPYGYLPLPKDLADAALAVLDKVREPPPESPPEVTFEAPPGDGGILGGDPFAGDGDLGSSGLDGGSVDESAATEAAIANGAAVASRRAEAARRLALPERLRAAAARLVLPLLAGLGLFCLLFGPFLQFRARLRR